MADFQSKLVVAVVGAIFGFIFALILDVIKRRREPRRELSYSISEREIALDDTLPKAVQVTYLGKPVNDLHIAVCRLTNTGNQILKGQYIRFEFDRNAVVTDSGLVTASEPEFQVKLRADSSTWAHASERRSVQHYIGHLEPGNSVEFLFVVESKEYSTPKLKPYNVEGSPKLVETRVQKSEAERAKVVSLLRSLAVLGSMGLLADALPLSLPIGNLFWAMALYAIARDADSIVRLFRRDLLGDRTYTSSEGLLKAGKPGEHEVGTWAAAQGITNSVSMGTRNWEQCLHDLGYQGGRDHRG